MLTIGPVLNRTSVGEVEKVMPDVLQVHTAEHDRSDRETAAAIAVAMAMALLMDRAGAPAAAVLEPNMWRSYGRREQLLSRLQGAGQGARRWR